MSTPGSQATRSNKASDIQLLLPSSSSPSHSTPAAPHLQHLPQPAPEAGPGDLDTPEQDDIGNSLEPSSPYFWLHRVRLRLGRSTQAYSREADAGTAAMEHSIFSHGDIVDTQTESRVPLISIECLPWPTVSAMLQCYFERAAVTYRFLHAPTVESWLKMMMGGLGADLSTVQRAISLLALAHGALYLTPAGLARLDHGHGGEPRVLSSGDLFSQAMSFLEAERGRPTLESIQVRLMKVHHLLGISRPNEAWYTFGTVVQLTWALGLHRAALHPDRSALNQQVQKRTFWSVYATDKYLSIAMGRPMLLHDCRISQEMPLALDDACITDAGICPEKQIGDCIMSATILHIRLSVIVAQGIQEQYEPSREGLLQAVMQNRRNVEQWKSQLPPFLSGEVHASSLLPKFQRQAVVMRLFYLHAVVLINRPSLAHLLAGEQEEPGSASASSIQDCMDASTELAQRMIHLRKDEESSEIYWFTQSITFNAIAILYLYVLRTLQLKGRVPEAELGMWHLAIEAHAALHHACQGNALNLRYSSVLTDLRQEVEALGGMPNGVAESSAQLVADCQNLSDREPILSLSDFEDSSNWPMLEEQFWPWLDSLPIDQDRL